LSISRANFKAGLWMNRGAIHYTTILQSKEGRMIWAHDAISYKFTFGKRPAKVGACVSHGEDTVSATNEQNRQALIHRLGRFAVGQCRFRQDGDKLIGEDLAICAIDAYSMFVNHFAAQVRRISHNRISESADDAAAPAGLVSSQKKGRYK